VIDYKEYLKQHGIKNSKQRNLLMTILSQANGIMTAEEIYLALKKQEEKINLSTVYRILEVFVEKGLVVKSSFPSNNTCVFTLKQLEHSHHLICLNCKKTVSLPHCPLHEFEHSIEKETNFNITDHNLELYGYCNNCK